MRGGVDKGRWMRVYQLVRAEQAAMQRTDYLASICKLICACVCVCVQAHMLFSLFLPSAGSKVFSTACPCVH